MTFWLLSGPYIVAAAEGNKCRWSKMTSTAQATDGEGQRGALAPPPPHFFADGIFFYMRTPGKCPLSPFVTSNVVLSCLVRMADILARLAQKADSLSALQLTGALCYSLSNTPTPPIHPYPQPPPPRPLFGPLRRPWTEYLENIASRDVIATMLVYNDNRVAVTFFCCVHQHGRHTFCHLNPWRLSASQELSPRNVLLLSHV